MTDIYALVDMRQRSMGRQGSLLSSRVFWKMCCKRVREFCINYGITYVSSRMFSSHYFIAVFFPFKGANHAQFNV